MRTVFEQSLAQATQVLFEISRVKSVILCVKFRSVFSVKNIFALFPVALGSDLVHFLQQRTLFTQQCIYFLLFPHIEPTFLTFRICIQGRIKTSTGCGKFALNKFERFGDYIPVQAVTRELIGMGVQSHQL